jgi:hypothetical protein
VDFHVFCAHANVLDEPLELAERVERYLNLNGTSGVVSYEIGFGFIRIEFRNDAVYRYDFNAPGKEHVERMKELAISGRA